MREKGLRSVTASILAVVVLLSLLVVPASAKAEMDVAKWTADISTIRDKILSVYYSNQNAKVGVTKDAINASFDGLISSLPDLDQQGRFFELSKIVASLKDGHAGVYRDDYLFYPLNMYWLDDGLYLTSTTEPYKAALNMKLYKIADKSFDEMFKLLDPFISYDSISWKKHTFWYYATDAQLLRHVGVTESVSECRFTFIDDEGKTVDLNIKSVSRNSKKIEWVSDPEFERMMKESPPLCFSKKGTYFFVPMDDRETMYVYYGKCIEDTKHPFAAFMKELKQAWSAGKYKRLVLDMRFNSGGGTPLLYPLTDWVKTNEDLRLPGSFYVLVGKRTFSAAVQNVALMYQETVATFVGEPTGQKPNHWGQVSEIKLEKTNLVFVHSTRHMTVMDNQDPDAIFPDTEILWNHKDYFKGIDTVLEAVSQGNVPPTSRDVFVRMPRVDSWSADIRQFEVNLLLKYPEIGRKIDKKSLHEQFESLISKIGTIDDLDIALELSRITKVLENPYFYLSSPEYLRYDYFVQIRNLGDGLYFTFTNKANEAILGKKITGIGSCSMDKVREQFAKYFYFEDFENFVNDTNLFTMNADILFKLGIIPDPEIITVRLEKKEGGTEEVVIKKMVPSQARDGFVSLPSKCAGKKIFKQKYSQGMWYEYLEEQKTFYMSVEFTSLPNDERYDRREYAQKIIEIIKGKDVNKIVLDYRKTNAMYVDFVPSNTPFYEELSKFIKESGKYKTFALVDKGSPSNSVFEAACIKRLADALVVGETPVLSPTEMYSCYYDTTANKKIVYGIPVDKQSAEGYQPGEKLVPNKMIIKASEDYFNCIDPALEWIFE